MEECFRFDKFVLVKAFVILILICWCGSGFGQTEDKEMRVRKFLAKPPDDLQEMDAEARLIPKYCVELGDKASSFIRQDLPRMLTSFMENRTRANAVSTDTAMQCLIYLGGPEVVDLFQKLYNEAKNETLRDVMRSRLCWAMQSTGSPEDIRFLIQSLKGPIGGPKGLAPQAAAYSLAVLRPASAKVALEARVKETNRYEAKYALSRLSGRPLRAPQMNSAGSMDRIILTVFEFGIPHIEESGSYTETEKNRQWRHEGDSWLYEPLTADSTGGLHRIRFDITISKDDKRAICSVGIFCGNACGYGYDFILEKDKDFRWRVKVLFPTWIS